LEDAYSNSITRKMQNIVLTCGQKLTAYQGWWGNLRSPTLATENERHIFTKSAPWTIYIKQPNKLERQQPNEQELSPLL
jgi:hypothetical protein